MRDGVDGGVARLMSSLIDLPARLRARGVHVVEFPGWQTRKAVRRDGTSPFYPKATLVHDTASGRRYDGSRSAPSLNVVVHGRSDLPGPLYQGLIGYQGEYHVVAAGRANHAGRGQLPSLGLSKDNGNAESVGVALENAGGVVKEPYTSGQLATLTIVLQELAGIVGAGVAGHRDYSADGKIDTWNLSRAQLTAMAQQPAEDIVTPEQMQRLIDAQEDTKQTVVRYLEDLQRRVVALEAKGNDNANDIKRHIEGVCGS